MKLPSRLWRGIKNGLRLVGFSFASLLLPTHGKRILFIASLYCYIARLDSLRDEALEKLNAATSLAKYGTALRFPAAVRDMVWGDVNVQSVLTMDVLNNEVTLKRAQEIAENVVAISPKWVRYRNRRAMVEDVRELIQNTTNLFQEAHAV